MEICLKGPSTRAEESQVRPGKRKGTTYGKLLLQRVDSDWNLLGKLGAQGNGAQDARSRQLRPL